jgi:hypothetical protein
MLREIKQIIKSTKLPEERYRAGSLSLKRPTRKEEKSEVMANRDSRNPICKPEKPRPAK